MANTTNYEVRHEDFGDGMKTWAIYKTSRDEETGVFMRTYLQDASTEEAALDIIDILLSEPAAQRLAKPSEDGRILR